MNLYNLYKYYLKEEINWDVHYITLVEHQEKHTKVEWITVEGVEGSMQVTHLDFLHWLEGKS